MDSTSSSSNGPLRVAIMGSGNWGSAIAKIVGENVKLHSDLFHTTVNMWVYEELIEGQKLTDIINTKHENVKYLPGIGLPENVIAVPDSVEAAKGANLLIFVLPHQFVEGLCKKLKGHVAPDCKAISLIKGMLVENGSPKLISQLIHDALEVNTAVLMGANIATEVAKGELSEATIGFREEVETAKIWQKLFNTSTFRINIIEDVAGVELCGALKNIVAIGAGFCDGLGLSPNSKVAIIRCGLAEMRKFCESFYSGIAADTFFESCGAADLIVTCYCGRNRKVAEAFAKTRKSFDELEQEMLNGQKLQGTLTAKEVHEILENKGLLHEFPLFTKIYNISYEGEDPATITQF